MAANLSQISNTSTGCIEDDAAEFNLIDDDDDLLLSHVDDDIKTGAQEEDSIIDLDGINFDKEMEEDEAANISIGIPSDGYIEDTISGFDNKTGNLWIYPTNYPIRDYQYNIVQQSLFKNTLVVLPTGLGKTFIAAVVMYNLYRWFPQGKIVFMAPTKPLVAQQINACYNIMGIPKEDTVEMTGTMPPTVRQKAWREKRVVFLTPQVITNDLSRGSCTAESIKCLVVDEAHKAVGNHSYCQVVRELVKFARQFRVLALSATPGGDLKAVQQVINNLLISHIELRTEESIDIRSYTHVRKVDKIVVPLGEELTGVRLQYIQIMTCVVQRLIRNQVVYNRDVTKLSKFLLLKSREEFRQNPPQNLQQAQFGNIEADFALAISLYHGFELLQLHGLRSLYNYLMGIISGDKGYGRTRSELLRNTDFNDIMENLRQKFSASGLQGCAAPVDCKLAVGHPKMQRLEEIVVEHFKSFENKGLETRVMIFSQYRDSVQEIASILQQHQPLVKVMPFIGQSSAGKATKGYTQKEQLMVMKKFREGGYNTLVSTCVGEEGLDIGDVDLIICFDAHKSPIRLVQRMGRTGRKRKGRIVMLVTEGKEEQIYNQSQCSKRSIHKAILNGARSLHFYPNNPRMVPSSIHPRCHKMFITVAMDSKNGGRKSCKNVKLESGSKLRKISDVFGKKGAKNTLGEGHLTQDEHESIREEYAMVPSLAKHIPKPKCICLKTGRKAESKSPNNEIHFSEWMPWQNRLQKAHISGHSVQSVHLVKDAEFIQLQQAIGEEEDCYGVEMGKYLADPNLSKSVNVGQSSIVSFLSTKLSKTDRVKESDLEDNINFETQKGNVDKNQKRRTSVKPDSVTKGSIVLDIESSWDDDPPNGPPDESCGVLKARNSSMVAHEVVSSRSAVVAHEVVSSRSAVAAHDIVSSRSGKVDPNKSSKQKSGNAAVERAARKSGKQTAVEGKSKKSNTNRKKKEKSTSGQKCVANSPNFKSKQKNKVKKIFKGNESSIPRTDNISTNGFVTTGNAEVELIEHEPGLQHRPSQRNSASFKEMENIEQSDIKCSPKQVIPGSLVPTAPDVSEVALLFKSLKSASDFAELDLESLVAEWSKSVNIACEDLMHSNRQEFLPEKPKGVLKSFNKSFIDQSKHDTSLESKLLEKCVFSCSNSPASEKTDVNCSNYKEQNSNFVTEINPLTIYVQTTEFIDFDDKSPIKSPMFKSLVGRSSFKSRNLLGSTPARPHLSKEEVTLNFTLELEEEEIVEIINSEEGQKIADNEHRNKVTYTLASGAEDIDIDPGEFKATTPNKLNVKNNMADLSSFITATQALDCLDFSSSDGSNDGHPLICPVPVSKTLVKSQVTKTSMNHREASLDEKSRTLKPFFEKMSSQTVLKHTNNSVEAKTFFEKHDMTRDSNSVNPFVVSNKINTVPVINSGHFSGNGDSKTSHISSPSPPPAFTPTKDPSHDSAELDLPQFDLGFDLDDDVIPPTPCKNISRAPSMGLKIVTLSRHASLGHLDTSSRLKVTKPFHSYSESFNFNNSNKGIHHSVTVRDGESETTAVCQTNVVKSSYIQHTLKGSSMRAEKQEVPPPCKLLPNDKVLDSTLANTTESGTETVNEFPSTPDYMDMSLIESTPEVTNAKLIFKTKQAKFGKNKQNVMECSENLTPVQRVKRRSDDQQHGRFIDMINKPSGKLMSSYVNSAEEETDVIVTSLPKKVKLSVKKHYSTVKSSTEENANLNRPNVMVKSKNDSFDTDRLEVPQQVQTNFCSEALMSKPEKRQSISNSTDQANKLRLSRLRLGEKRERFCQLNRPAKELVTTDINVKTDNVCKSSPNISLRELLNVDLGGKDSSQPTSSSSSTALGKCEISRSSAGFSVSDKEPVSNVDVPPGMCAVPHRQKCKLAALAVEVKASTPIRLPVAKKILSSDDDMDLTPIEKINRPNLAADKDEPEESFIIKRRKKPAAVLLDISSDQEGSKDKIKTKETDSSSAHDSSRSWTTHKMPKFLLSDGGNVDDDDDFEGEGNRQVIKSKLEKEKFGHRTKSRKGNAFIEEEAEVSGEDNSSDEHEEFDDYFDASFIDNNTEVQHMNDTEMRAVYLKSVKSPLLHAMPGRFKLHYKRQNHRDVDIYSQTQPDDLGMSEYEEDSFCVGSDEIETSHTEEECSERFTKISKQPKKGKTLAGKRRIQLMCDSSSDEDADRPFPMTQDFPVADLKRVKKALLSSSEDEEAKTLSKLSPKTLPQLSPNNKLSDIESCDAIAVRGNPPLDSSCEEKLKPLVDIELDDMAQTVNFNLLEDDDWYDDTDFMHVDEVKAKSTESSTVGSGSFLLAGSSRNKTTAVITPFGFTPEVKQTSISGPPLLKHERKNINELNESDADGASQCSELFFRGKRENFGDQSLTKKISERGDKYVNALLKNVRSNSSKIDANTIVGNTISGNTISGNTIVGSTIGGNTIVGNTCIVNTYQSRKDFSCSEASLGSIKKCLNESLHSSSTVHCEKMTSFNKPSMSMTREDFNKPSTSVMTREERLRKQKEKQEKFQQRLHQKQLCNSSTSNGVEPEQSPSLSRLSSSVNLTEVSGSCPSPVLDMETRAQASPTFTKLNTKKPEELQILVDSREISGAQDIISALRIKHGIKVTARQISSCDYILSNHQAVDRILWSAFSNSTNKSKMAARLSEMQALYDRCILIVEADRVKAGQEKSKKTWHHNKYVDTTTSQIIQTRVKIYFSDSMDQTAALLSELCHMEAKKGRALTVPTSLNSRQEEILKFILTIPRVTVPQALNLVHHYHSIAELICSSPGIIQERGRMTAESAQIVHQFLHHEFDLQMMPNS